MSFVFRPAKRENTPLIIGLAGPTKSGKTMSALRLAAGLTSDLDRIAMLNAEGKRGEQYADWFQKTYGKQYLNCNIEPPYTPERYTEALLEMKKLNPTVGIVDSASHMHDGPGGLLEYHDKELERLAGTKTGSDRDKYNWTAWIKPKAAENKFIYTMLGMDCPVILCFRAKEKLRIVPGKQPVDLGWQPIAGDRITFETIFTLVLPPHSKGVPDLKLSEMRQPFDTMVPSGKAIDEDLGRKLTEWAKGSTVSAVSASADGEKQQRVTAPQTAGRLDIDDIRDIETAIIDSGLDAAYVAAQVLGPTKYKQFSEVPKTQKPNILKWIAEAP